MNIKTLAFGALAGLALTACGGGDLVREGVPTGTLEIRNASNMNLGVVTISQCSASSHGGNKMGFGNWIEPGDSAEWEVSEGCYDVEAGGNIQMDGSYDAASTRLDVIAGQRMIFTVN